MALLTRPFGWPAWGGRTSGELERVRREMDRLFENLSGGSFREPRAGVFPLANLSEDSDNYYVRAELAGIKASDLDVSVTADGLSISGERKIPPEKADAKYQRREREAGKFSRIIGLPGPIETDHVKASCADGILTVVLPKAQSAKPRQIAVKAG